MWAASLRKNRTRRRAGADPSAREDRIWAITGLTLAAGVSFGAYVEIRSNDGTPAIYGSDHLALFARPARRQDASADRMALDEAPQPSPGVGVDFDPTAAIRLAGVTLFEPRADAEVSTHVGLRLVERGRGAFQGTNGLVFLAPGDTAPGGGTIRSFARRNVRWVAIVAPASGGQNSR